MEKIIHKIGFYICGIFTLGYGMIPASFVWFYQDKSFNTSTAEFFYKFVSIIFFVFVGIAWYLLNKRTFNKYTTLANIISFLLYIYLFLIGGVFAGVGM